MAQAKEVEDGCVDFLISGGFTDWIHTHIVVRRDFWPFEETVWDLHDFHDSRERISRILFSSPRSCLTRSSRGRQRSAGAKNKRESRDALPGVSCSISTSSSYSFSTHPQQLSPTVSHGESGGGEKRRRTHASDRHPSSAAAKPGGEWLNWKHAAFLLLLLCKALAQRGIWLIWEQVYTHIYISFCQSHSLVLIRCVWKTITKEKMRSCLIAWSSQIRLRWEVFYFFILFLEMSASAAATAPGETQHGSWRRGISSKV